MSMLSLLPSKRMTFLEFCEDVKSLGRLLLVDCLKCLAEVLLSSHLAMAVSLVVTVDPPLVASKRVAVSFASSHMIRFDKSLGKKDGAAAATPPKNPLRFNIPLD
jgi:hypothetical protein